MNRRSAPQLGDLIAIALAKAGLTKDKISKILGKPCKCDERQERLNQLGNWAKRVMADKPLDPKHLDDIIGSPD